MHLVVLVLVLGLQVLVLLLVLESQVLVNNTVKLSHPSFEVDVSATVDEKASDCRVAIMRSDM